MIKKIITCGKSHAEKAAIDAAVKFNIPYVDLSQASHFPKDDPLIGRLLPSQFLSKRHLAIVEQSVIDSSGTLIFSAGNTGDVLVAIRKIAQRHDQPVLEIAFADMAKFKAGQMIHRWLREYRIANLHVIGVTENNDCDDYRVVLKIFSIVHQFGISQESLIDRSSIHLPQTVDEAVGNLMASLPLKDKATMANMQMDEIQNLQATLGRYVLQEFRLRSENRQLLEDCKYLSKNQHLDPKQASLFIMEALWKKLKKTHKLRVVK
jgi:hypothetical protein